MARTIPLIEADGPILVFGGPYSNLQATEAVLAEARRIAIPPSRVVCTGDLAAYCASPDETVSLVRDSGIHVVLGNCDEQLGSGGADCACGFAPDSDCGRLSAAWYAHADGAIAARHRPWLAALPPRIDLKFGATRLAVIHGGAALINQFHFATVPTAAKRADLDLIGADGIVCGHSGLPFSEVIDGRLWHNAGVVGLPANDGTPRVWYSVLTPAPLGLRIAHCALHYDHDSAMHAFAGTALPADYRAALGSGLWPNCDILPIAETRAQGVALTPAELHWTPTRNARSKRPGRRMRELLWPAILKTDAMAETEHVSLFKKTEPNITPSTCCAPPESSEPAATPPPEAASCCSPAANAEAARALYRDAALTPDTSLCCVANPVWQLPGLKIPRKMIDMNYGCGCTVHPADLAGSPTILYVGAGAGLELLQFAYFARRRGAVIGLDVVDEMMRTCRQNLDEAEALNPWFDSCFVDLRRGDALALPIADASIDVAAQNCLFNIFHEADLETALAEMARVLKPGGRLIMSDPIAEDAIPAHLKADERLRAMCLTGALPLSDYIARLARAGFGRIEVRARRPYRVLGPEQHGVAKPILLESVEICAIRCDVPPGGPEIMAGETALYFGTEAVLALDGLPPLAVNQPTALTMSEAARLRALKRADVYVSAPTWSAAIQNSAASKATSTCC